MELHDGQVRHATVEFRGFAGKDGTLEGYASVWGSRNTFGEVFVPGCFDSAIATRSDRKPLVMGYMHRDAIGKWPTIRSDEEGLFLAGKPSDTALGRDARVLTADGALTGLSIGYLPAEVQYAGPNERCTFNTPFGERSYSFPDFTIYITDVAVLAEASLVIAPSDDDARLLQVRSILQKAERALPALQLRDDASWDDVAYSMAFLMGGRGSGPAFADVPDLEHFKLHARLSESYKRHGKEAPPYERRPEYKAVEFRHDERAIFTDRYLRKQLDSIVSGLAGIEGPLSLETRERAAEARTHIDQLLTREQEPDRFAKCVTDLQALRQTLAN
jgi:HK97 family phage prohead protease